MLLAFSAQAQTISKNALGLRLETVAVLELKSLTKEVLDNNRLELDLGLRNRKIIKRCI
jgi:hypothetical protein